MAKTKNNIFMSGLSGTIGKQMTLSVKTNDTIVGKKRVASNIPATAEQIDVRDRFRMATSYAQSVLQDPVLKAAYAAIAKAAQKNQSAYNIAVKDAFSPPEIQIITTTAYHGQPGDTIQVRAKDIFKLASVHVAIYTAAGVLVEEGNAVVLQNTYDWKYTTTVQNADLVGSIIRVTATDLPANETVKEAIVS